jgi:hypothetical protein
MFSFMHMSLLLVPGRQENNLTLQADDLLASFFNLSQYQYYPGGIPRPHAL